MNMLIKSLLASATILSASAAVAAPLTLSGPLSGADRTQQTATNPCIFGDPSCDAGLLGTYTQFPAGNVASYSETQSYSLATVRAAVGNVWDIGVDVNTTNAAGETLDLFTISLDGVVIYSYTGGANIATGISNGTGYSDWLLSSVDLTGLTGTNLTFAVQVGSPSDGREQFFIVDRPEGGTVPVPGSLLLMGLGLAGIGFASRKKA